MNRPCLLILCLGLGACTSAPLGADFSPAVPGSDVLTTISGNAAEVERGAAFAVAHCSGCHAVGPAGLSPNTLAPPLREIGRRYPVEQLSEAFAEGIVTAHPAMPQFELTPEQNRSLIAYLKTIQSPGTE